MKRIILGTRGSKLALIQTDIVKKLLEKLAPDTEIVVQIITTTGDKNMKPVPLDTVGKGWFTKEIDKALFEGAIDVAVHSLKDLPEVLPEGLLLVAIPEREDAREALVSRNNLTLAQLPANARIGTDSLRRRVQILAKRPDVRVESVRGNVNRRLEKLDAGEYDGLFLAVAGLKRLAMDNRIAEYFSVTDIIPSPGQGALAVVIKKDNTKLIPLLKKMNHESTITAISAERVFSQTMGGGCKLPVGVYAACKGADIAIHGVVGSLDATHILKDSIKGKKKEALLLAKKLAERMLENSSSWYTKITSSPKASKYVVITRPLSEKNTMHEKIKNLGLDIFIYPSIAIEKNTLSKKSREGLLQLASFDWIVFTSHNGITFFMQELKKLGISTAVLHNKKIAAVGPQTANAVKQYGLSVAFTPSKFTTKNLGEEIKNISGKKILLPRANIATARLKKLLEKKGAIVTHIPIYKTTYYPSRENDFANLLDTQQIYCVCFTSPSTVKGFLKNTKGLPEKTILSLPILSIGPVTTKALKRYGFTNIRTAEIHTLDGVLQTLQESIL